MGELNNTQRENMVKLKRKHNLSSDDFFKHKHYTIITRQGVDKIQASAGISVSYEVVRSESDFCVVKAIASHDNKRIETFGSAKYGGKAQDPVTKKWIEIGSTTSWYVMEMAEKRAMSRVVLKLAGFYELGVYAEDEAEDFGKSKHSQSSSTGNNLTNAVKNQIK